MLCFSCVLCLRCLAQSYDFFWILQTFYLNTKTDNAFSSPNGALITNKFVPLLEIGFASIPTVKRQMSNVKSRGQQVVRKQKKLLT